MLTNLPGYNVTVEELKEYIDTLTVPDWKVSVEVEDNLYKISLDDKLLYYSEPEVTVEQEKERLTNNWWIEQAQIHFADKKIVPASEPEPLPELTDRELLNETHDLILESNINSEYIASLIELGL